MSGARLWYSDPRPGDEMSEDIFADYTYEDYLDDIEYLRDEDTE